MAYSRDIQILNPAAVKINIFPWIGIVSAHLEYNLPLTNKSPDNQVFGVLAKDQPPETQGVVPTQSDL